MESVERRCRDIPAYLILFAMLWVAALRLWATDWTANLQRIELLVMVGCLLGFLLGLSIFSAGVVRWLAFLYSIIIVPWQLARTVEGEGLLWADRFRILGDRFFRNARIFAENRPVEDSILFLAAMALLFWLISLIASYQLVRSRRPWMALAVAGLAMVLVEFYHSFLTSASLLTALFLFFGLMLVGRMHYLERRIDWEENNVGVDAEVGFNISRGMLVAGVLLVLVAWNFPSLVNALSPGTAEQEWVSISWQSLRNRMSNMVASLQAPPAAVPNDFGNILGLGTGATLGDDTIMIVTPAGENLTGARYYWRGRSFDSFNNSQWVNTVQELREVPVLVRPFDYPVWSPLTPVEVSIQTVSSPSRTMYSPGHPVQFDRKAMAQLQLINEEEVDVVSVMASPTLRPGDSYRVLSMVSTPTIRQLRQSPEVYPAWAAELYLQLPEDFPESITALAEDLTAGLDNPYDKAQAITQYLRENIEYVTTVESAPPGEDPIEWFLFVDKKGYCNYYATAEVLMLRSIGIPARLVTGYAEGQSRENGMFFTVQRKDSHAWPEVYFYGAGWVPFEPTVSQPVYALPEGSDLSDQEQLDERGSALDQSRNLLQERPDPLRPDQLDLSSNSGNNLPWRWIILSSAALAIGLLVLVWYRQQRLGRWKPFPVMIENNMRKRGAQPPRWLQTWSRYVQSGPIERIFAGIPWMVRFLGGNLKPSQTPTEQVAALLAILPSAEQSAGVVLEAYERAMFSAHEPDLESARQANAQLWRQVLRGWLNKHFGIQIEVT